MRELKFRAWHKILKNYAYIKRIWLDGDANGHDEIFAVSDAETTYPICEIVLEQYTGLKDKNGKEIYEGDIVAQELIDDPFAGGYPTYIVCWDEEFLGWALKDTTGDDGNDTDLHFFIAERRKCEVIGNIHETQSYQERRKNEKTGSLQ